MYRLLQIKIGKIAANSTSDDVIGSNQVTVFIAQQPWQSNLYAIL
jgi:hypothetical protein